MQLNTQSIDPLFHPIPISFGALPTPQIEVMMPPANRLIDVVSRYYPGFESTLPLPAHVRQAVRMMTMCHTPALGGHLECCPNGHVDRVFYNSCGHRFCPRCASRIRQKWLLDREPKLLPVRHYHTTFTLPHTFNPLWHLNPRVMGDLLFHSGVDALKALLADPRWLGAKVGITVTLETWDDRMFFHPHLHCLVTGGGLTLEGEWIDVANPRFLVAVKALMWEFRKRFCRGLKQLLIDGVLTLPENTTQRVWSRLLKKSNRLKWSVFISKQPEDGGPTPSDILRYQAENVAGGPLSGDRLLPKEYELSAAQLAYLKSAPLNESRLALAPEGQISFYWGNYNPTTGKRERTQIETLPAADFLQRYLQHIPPSGYQTVRHYGLYTSAAKTAYERCAGLLSDRQPPKPLEETNDESPNDNESWISDHTCSVCGEPLIVTKYLPSTRTGQVTSRPPLGPVAIRFPTQRGFHAT